MEMAFSTCLYNTDYYSVRNFICFSFSFSYSNSNLKVLFYKDCSLGSVKNLTTRPAKQLMSKYKVAVIIYIPVGMNE